MSMTPVPVCWQTTVTAENKKECALAHSRAEARLPRQPSTLAPSAHPRGAFLSYGNEVSYTIKNGMYAAYAHPVLFLTVSIIQRPDLRLPCRYQQLLHRRLPALPSSQEHAAL